MSFASNHPPPDNVPFESFATIANPSNASETERSRLWPDHCVQDSPGAQLVPELDVAKVDRVVDKGTDDRVEMYSAFQAPFKNPVVARSEVPELLKEKAVERVYVVGLAADYCVKYSALHAVEEGIETVVIREATRAVDAENIEKTFEELEKAGVRVVEGVEDVKKELV